MSATNTGPRHARECPTTMTSEAVCRCERAAWLDELVPRAQARGEVLDQLATWAHEQGIFAETSVGQPEQDDESRRARWRASALRLGAGLARDVYIGVRMTALALAKECTRPEPAQPGAARHDEPDQDEVADPQSIETVVVAGGLL